MNIPYGRQSIDERDIEAVVRVLRGGWLTQGPAITEFEESLSRATGARHAVAFSSGTAALHAAAHAARLGEGDVVATSPLSFVASANAARYVGAETAFVDIDPSTLNLDPALVPSSASGVVAVHYAGLPLDLSAFPTRPTVVIEDAAHAVGALTPDGPVGNCARSDMCCFSFHPVKTVTTGEGGAVTTNSAEFADTLRRFRHHGIAPTPEQGEWTYDVPTVGFNYRMTDIQAALGTSQLQRLEEFVARRNEIAIRYRVALADVPRVVLPPEAPPGYRHAYHLFAVRVPDRARVLRALRSEGVGAQVHYVPIYRFSAYSSTAGDPDRYPRTEEVYAGLLSLPMFPALTDREQDRVVEALLRAVAEVGGRAVRGT